MGHKRAFKKGAKKKSVKRVRAVLFFCILAAVLILLLLYLNSSKNPSSEQVESYGQLANLPASGNLAQVNETEEAVITTFQSTAVIGQPVKWTKQIVPKEEGSLIVEIPKQAENIDINKVKEDAEASIISGEVIKGSSEVKVSYLKSTLKKILGLTGRTVDEQFIEINMNIDESGAEYYIKYETPAPEATELLLSENEKKIIISAPDHLGYKNILAFTSLPREVPYNNLKLYHEIDGIKERVEAKGYDKNENGLIDYIEWNVPHLSNQSYLLVIEISKAEHLDENKEFVSDIYNEVVKQDGLWSETISNNEYVRATFEQALDNSRDITLYARASGEARIEVYISGTDAKIAEFESIAGENTYKVYLTEIPDGKSYETFDLKVIGAVELDYIVDPSSYCYNNPGASTCDSFDSNQAGCGATASDPQYGCAWEACNGTATACSGLSQSSCGATVNDPQYGCSWVGCNGSVLLCEDSLFDNNKVECLDQYGCYWDGCSGSADYCSSFTDVSCNNQGGCNWDACSGSTPDCDSHTGISNQAACSAAGCDNLGSPDYVCYGAHNSCDSYDSYDESEKSNCELVGCSWSGCTGTAYTCNGAELNDNKNGCLDQGGCHWEGCYNNPGATACSSVTQLHCNSQGGCSWTGCSGTATTCNGLDSSQSQCNGQLGCSWSACNGTATACYNLNTSYSSCTNQAGCSYQYNDVCSGVDISASGTGCGGNHEIGTAITLTYNASCQSDPLSTMSYTNLGVYEGLSTLLECNNFLSTGDCSSTANYNQEVNWTPGDSVGATSYYASCYAGPVASESCAEQGEEECVITWRDTVNPTINILSSPSANYVCSGSYEFSAYVWDLDLYEWFFTGGPSTCSGGGGACPSNICTVSCSGLGAGTYSQHWSASDNSFNDNDTYPSFTINKATPTGSLSVSTATLWDHSDSWGINNGTEFTIGVTESNCGDGDVVYKIWRKKVGESSWVDVGSGETWTPTRGSYTYVLNTTGGQNYSAISLLHTKTLVVNGPPSLSVAVSQPTYKAGSQITGTLTMSDLENDQLSIWCGIGTANNFCGTLDYWVYEDPLNTQSLSCSGSLIDDGTNGVKWLVCRVSDSPGNLIIDSSDDYIADGTTPTITITSIGGDTTAPYVTPDTTPSAVLSTQESATCRASFDDEGYDDMADDYDCGPAGTSHTCDLGLWTEGPYTVYFACVDSIGNNHTSATNTEADFTIKITPPTITVVAVGADDSSPYSVSDTSSSLTRNVTTSESATCKWDDADVGYDSMGYSCSADAGGTGHACGGAGKGDGSYTDYIACVDEVGNNHTSGTNTEVSYEIDSTAPIQSGHSPSDGSTIYTYSPAITFSTDEDARCLWSLTDQDYGSMSGSNTCDSSYTTSHSCSVSGLTGDIDYVYTACADDTEYYANEDTAGTNTHLGYYILQLNVSLSKGWNLFAVISNYSNDGKDRNISVEAGWNLIGYSSNVSVNLSQVIFTNSSGSRYTWQQAISARKVQAYLIYRENNRYKYVGLEGSGMHDYALKPGRASWDHVSEPGNITLPGVGGSPPQSQGQTFSFSSLQFHNGTNLANMAQMTAGTYDWVFLQNDFIYFRDVDINDFEDICGNIMECYTGKTTVSPWEGYFIWSDYNNITMIVYP